jgi:alpha-L-arabinofuranosidase
MVKRILKLIVILNVLLLSCAFASKSILINQSDSVYLFSYGGNKPSAGLQFAWSTDEKNWKPIGRGNGFLRSDYGPGGSQKKMFNPFLIFGEDGMWHCIWSLNDTEPIYAHAASPNLIDWNRQSYQAVSEGLNFLRPGIKFDQNQKNYLITYTDASGKFFAAATKDFKRNESARKISAINYIRSVEVNLLSGKVSGQIHRVEWAVVDRLIKAYQFRDFRNISSEETSLQDAYRFADLKPVEAKFTVDVANAKPISNTLIGVFFEDLNYAADGGLYAELIQNRDFEYDLHDKFGHDKSWTHTYSWSSTGLGVGFTIDSTAPIHPNNPHYGVLKSGVGGGSLINAGFDGIPLKQNKKYNFSFFSKLLSKGKGKLKVRLIGNNGAVFAETVLAVASGPWRNLKAVLTSNATVADARLELQVLQVGKLAVDMISLFPQDTYKSRTNGLRADLAETIADIHPRFVRFPGGCLAHGDGINNIYRWKNTIGPLEARKPQRNIWHYHQSAGLGYFEYFQFCEDIGAEPVPVVAAGVPCQNSVDGGNGQHGGIPMEQMGKYVQDVIDLVEWANGDVNTKWGKVRALAGHPKPFNLKYIGVGNEDMITDVFEERFTMIVNALKTAHPEITVIGTAGPNFEGTDYREGWDLASKLKIPIVDEHYYNKAGWFINNQDFYDSYDRSKPKVYLGEYAATVPGRGANFESALSEAIYLTSLERNADVVSMSSYAPLLAREGHTQWNPDMIYFNNTEVKLTAAYQVQKLYGQNSGDQYLPVSVTLSNNQDAVKKRVAVSVVRDSKSKDMIIKLVNLLPVAVKVTTDLNNIVLVGEKITKTVLQGSLTDKNIVPKVSEAPITEINSTELPPYSFTVLRVKTK